MAVLSPFFLGFSFGVVVGDRGGYLFTELMVAGDAVEECRCVLSLVEDERGEERKTKARRRKQTHCLLYGSSVGDSS